MSRVVIVGAGHAGGRTAINLRRLGFPGPLTLLGEETDPPYERPPLSKAVLAGTAEPTDAALASAERYAEMDIDWRGAVEAVSIDTATQSVGLSNGDQLNYEHLILATGARARMIPLPGSALPGVMTLRSAADALALRERLSEGKRLVVIGGGFIGLEAAASARARRCEVTILEAAERLLTRSAPQIIADAVCARHAVEGVSVHTEATVEAIEGDGNQLFVRVNTGRSLTADTVLIAVGAVPEARLAEAAGLDVDDGIVTDSSLRTSDPRILAIGDCARAVVPRYGRRVRFESYQNAEIQAQAAAKVIMGEPSGFDPVPWLWSDQYDWALYTAGIIDLEDELISRPLDQAGAVLVFSMRSGRLTGAAGFGLPRQVVQSVRTAQKMIERGATPSPEQLADPAVALKRLVKKL